MLLLTTISTLHPANAAASASTVAVTFAIAFPKKPLCVIVGTPRLSVPMSSTVDCDCNKEVTKSHLRFIRMVFRQLVAVGGIVFRAKGRGE